MTRQLIIQLARFGDIVQTRRLVLSLQQEGEVCLCVDRSLESLARLVYPDVEILSLPAWGSDPSTVLTEGWSVMKRLARTGFDAVYALNHAGLCQALTALFDPAVVRGYPVDSGQVLRSNWVRLAFRWMARRTAPLSLVDFWAALAPHPFPANVVNPPARAGGAGLGVVLAGQHSRRSLPPEMLASVIHATFERLGGPVVRLLGGNKDRGSARRLLGCLPRVVATRTVDLTGRTDWRGLVDALTDLDLLLSPDTGTIHLAAHLGVPVEGLFCSSAWAFETGPYGLGHKVWQAVLPCSPCTESSPCPREACCRHAFRTPSFLARMQGGRGAAALRPLEHMVLLHSAFDEMGQIWHSDDGQPLAADADRRALRTLLGEYLGLKTLDLETGLAPEETSLAHHAHALFQEADWILPQAAP